MDLNRNRVVAARFAARAGGYARHASLQADIARTLGELLPYREQPAVLEVGCGTGFLTRHLLERYADGDFLITDLAPDMVDICREHHQRANGRAIRFAVMDGEAPDTGETFDVIALSMTLQWFTDPVSGLERLTGLLKPGGTLVYATLGPDCFPQWRAALDACDLPHGLIEIPVLPHVKTQELREIEYDGGIEFLESLKALGATTPRPGYEPLSPGSLRAALRRLERDHGTRMSWHIVYGAISAR